MRVLLIIPSYNEELNILNTINIIRNSKVDVDYIVINDGSTDKTSQVCEENNIKHINIISNLGIGGAVQTGYKYAYNNNYDIAIQFDGDGQHDIYSINKLTEPIINNEADFVIGSRFIENNSNFKSTYLRRVGIKFISFIIRIFTRATIYDTTSGFRACNKKVIEEFMKEYPTEYPEPISIVTLLNKGYIVKEVAAKMNERVKGKSSINTYRSIYYMINIMFSIIIVSIRRKKK